MKGAEMSDIKNEHDKRYPLVSVIVPMYMDDLLPRCLESILQQTYKQIEIIVVEDPSSMDVSELKLRYPTVNFYRNPRHRGLFRNRLTGFERSKGDYIAFVDSDDSITVDWIRTLVEQALKTEADLVLGDFLLEHVKGKYKCCPLFQTRNQDIYLEGEKIQETFFTQAGLDFSWHVMWNKLYSRELFSAAHDILNHIEESELVEDVLYSSVVYNLASKVTNIHNSHYICNKWAGLVTTNRTYENVIRWVSMIENTFKYIHNIFEDRGWNKYQENMLVWEDRLLQIWRRTSSSCLSGHKLKKAHAIIDKKLNNPKSCQEKAAEEFFSVEAPFEGTKLDDIKKSIVKHEYVSFDIFDTLIARPFLEPHDLFQILEQHANTMIPGAEFHFASLRSEAEAMARKRLSLNSPSFEDITLDEIYREMEEMSSIPSNLLAALKEKELELELKYCAPRSCGKELFELAQYLGKKILIVSDMYLSNDFILNLLHANGYKNFEKLFVSSELRMTKATGALYAHITHDLGIKDCVHIGDNYHSDVEKSKEYGWEAFYLPRASSVMRGQENMIFAGEFFSRVYKKKYATMAPHRGLYFIGIRCMLGVIANKFFDNPFVSYRKDSDFNVNPYFMGYFPLGMYAYALADSLAQQSDKYDTIHFAARDGWLILEALKILLCGEQNSKLNLNYLYVSRKSLLPLMINDQLGMDGLVHNVGFRHVSPMAFLPFLQEICDTTVAEFRSILARHNILPDKKFSSEQEVRLFFKAFTEHCLSSQKVAEFRAAAKMTFDSMFHGRNAIFDVGYSCRIDSLLKRNFGYDISCHCVHISGQDAIARAKRNSIPLHFLLPVSPCVTGCIRETCMAELGPSCIRYEVANGKLAPVFEEYTTNYEHWYIVNTLQQAALSFVQDMKNIFGDDLAHLHYRPGDACLPFEIFNLSAKDKDRHIFSCSWFEDDLGVGNLVNMKKFWDSQNVYKEAKKKTTIKKGFTFKKVFNYIVKHIKTFVSK